MEQEEWKKKLEEMVEEGFTVHRRSDDLMVALLEMKGDYVKLTPEGRAQPVSAADAKRLLAKQEKQEKAPRHGKLPERVERTVTVKEDGPAQVSIEEAMTYIEKRLGIHPMHVMIYHGRPYVMHGGLLEKADKKGLRAIRVEAKPLKGGGYEATAWVYPTLGKDTIELVKAAQGLDPDVQKKLLEDAVPVFVNHGTAGPDNVKMGAMKGYLKELAITRAINRALRLYTACGFTSAEEMSDYEGEVIDASYTHGEE